MRKGIVGVGHVGVGVGGSVAGSRLGSEPLAARAIDALARGGQSIRVRSRRNPLIACLNRAFIAP